MAVDTPPVAPSADPESKPEASRDPSSSQARLVWRGFRRHRVATVALVVVVAIYLVALLADVLATSDPNQVDGDYAYAPPQAVEWGARGPDGTWGPYVTGLQQVRDEQTLAVEYVRDESVRIPLGFFVQGYDYRLLGLIDSDFHIFGPMDPEEQAYLWGADRSGRDQFSRIVVGTRISMTVGLVGVAMAFVLGLVLGGISGYVGGKADTVIQRIVEFFMSIPTLPLWLGLAAALPPWWGPLQRYFAITVILAIIAWTDLARVVRGRFLAMRQEEFVTAAVLDGNSTASVIGRHMLPSFTSHLIASLTLSIPSMILAETALSFLGLGLQAPVISWGVLLQDAQNVRVITTAPWLMLPGVAVVIAVMALNFVGDGLRDAADPYKH